MDIPRRVYDRLKSKVYEIEGGCLTADVHLDGDGYLRTGWQTELGKPGHVTTDSSHRVMYWHEVGPIPSGMTVHHKCFVKRCLNSEHMQLLSNSENARRNNGRDWVETGVCPNGHPDAKYRSTRPGGSSYCKGCYAEDRALFKEYVENRVLFLEWKNNRG